MSNAQIAWRIYRTFVVIGVIAGAISYGAAALASSAPLMLFLMFTMPWVLGFCLVTSAPLAGIGLAAATILRRSYPSASEATWTSVGAVLGLASVMAALVYFLPMGALSNNAGRVFWVTFLAAAGVAGGRAARVARRALTEPAHDGARGAA